MLTYKTRMSTVCFESLQSPLIIKIIDSPISGHLFEVRNKSILLFERTPTITFQAQAISGENFQNNQPKIMPDHDEKGAFVGENPVRQNQKDFSCPQIPNTAVKTKEAAASGYQLGRWAYQISSDTVPVNERFVKANWEANCLEKL